MVGPRRVWFGWFLVCSGAAGAPAAALQHTMRGKVKQRGAGRPPLESRRGARSRGGAVLPLLCFTAVVC